MLLWLSIFILSSSSVFSSAPRCLDDDGNAVDWFALYKLPYIKGHRNYNIANGTGYVYITSTSVEEGWKLSEFNISNPKSIPGKTMDVVYSKTNSNDVNDLFWLMYNDRAPNQPYYDETDGHSKGVVIGSQDGGIWIVHSVPNFPTVGGNEGYQYPKTGHRYGQSFLCISLNKEELDQIGNQLIVNEVNSYDFKFEGNLQRLYPSLFSAAKKVRYNRTTNKILFNSADRVPFTSFAKSAKFGKDLYSQWLADDLKSELLVETWCHDSVLPSNCSGPYQTHNIERIKIDPDVCKFANLADHSKFAVSGQRENPWICVGDINRSVDQLSRGGGTVCLKNETLWKAYAKIVMMVQPCSN